MPACHAGDRRFESGRVRHLPRGKLPAHVSKGRSGEDYSLTHDEVLAPAVALEDDDIELAAMVTIGKALNALQPATRLRVLGWAASKYGDATVRPRFVTNNRGAGDSQPDRGFGSWLRRAWQREKPS